MYNLLHKLYIIKKALRVSFNRAILKRIKKSIHQSTNTFMERGVFKIRRQILKTYFDLVLAFITTTIPNTFVSVGNRKELYKLFTKKHRWFFNMGKKYTDKVTFLNLMVDFFDKIKELFFHTEAFSETNGLFPELFSHLFLETPYDKLIQVYKHEKPSLHHKRDRNKYSYFFNIMSFFLQRVDFFLLKFLSIFNLDDIRKQVYKNGISINGALCTSYNSFLKKYDIIKLPSALQIPFNNLYIMAIKIYLDFSNTHTVSTNLGKRKYLLSLYKMYHQYKKSKQVIKGKRIKHYYLRLVHRKVYLKGREKYSLFNYYATLAKDQYSMFKKNKYLFTGYDIFMSDLYTFFNAGKYEKTITASNYYDSDKYNAQVATYGNEVKFPFYTTRIFSATEPTIFKKNSSILNTKSLGNISISYRLTLISLLKSTMNLIPLTNYLNVFFYLYNYPLVYYYVYKNKIIVSPKIINAMLYEKKKLFSFFSVMFETGKVNTFAFSL